MLLLVSSIWLLISCRATIHTRASIESSFAFLAILHLLNLQPNNISKSYGVIFPGSQWSAPAMFNKLHQSISWPSNSAEGKDGSSHIELHSPTAPDFSSTMADTKKPWQ